MTTNANKHGLRKAAQERSKKHAQRTPLPPRPGQIEAAREEIPGELKAAQMAVETTDDRSKAKGAAFAERAVALGWSVEKAIVGGTAQVTATRGPEMIVQAWAGGVWQYDASVYAFQDRTTKPRNASGAVKLLERAAETAQAETNKVASNNAFRKREPKELKTLVLPLDPDLLTDAEAAKYFSGRTVKWYNRWTRGAETAMVSRNSPVRVTRHGEEVTISFCCPVSGFRAFHLSAVLAVGRGRSGIIKGSESASVVLEVEDAA